MSRLATALRAVFDSIVQESHSQLAWKPSFHFQPHPRLLKGDFSSSLPMALAQDLKRGAPEICARCIELIQPLLPMFEWSEDNGFLVVHRGGERSEWWDDELRSVRESCEFLGFHPGLDEETVTTIVVATSSRRLPRYATLRLQALAATQALYSVGIGLRCRVSFYGEAPQECTVTRDVLQMFSHAVTRVMKEDAHGTPGCDLFVREVGTQQLRQEVSSAEHPTLFLWTTHHTLQDCSPATRAAIETSRRENRCVLRMPNDGWLLSRERAIPEILGDVYLAQIFHRVSTLEGWMRVLLHLASCVPSAEYDPAVGLYDEIASPGFALRELWERLARLGREIDPEAWREAHVEMPRDTLAVLLWSHTLRVPWRRAAAVYRGEIVEEMACSEQWGVAAHAFLNSPVLRAALRGGTPSPVDVKILAGLKFVLSSIMLPTVEDRCATRKEGVW